ncbi:nucleoside diphosphate kinase [Cystobasidium minutum MCA 4210]|uniref:nucleoside diphosphate kinase n=1 Tax=Cystobasidium minutum MCA 4210 TaxID=1397322 RepID=UPI0034CD3C1A|eukprot:jgi/Rhomi1/162939/estExt_Genewise1Plus.C_6_t20063
MASNPAKLPYEITLGLIKPSLYASAPQVSQVMRLIKGAGFDVCRSRRIHWTTEEAEHFYAEHKGRFYFPRLVLAMSEPFMALALGKNDAIAEWRKLIGPTHVYKAQWERPETLRARFGISDTRNAFHGSDSEANARKELNMVFEGKCNHYGYKSCFANRLAKKMSRARYRLADTKPSSLSYNAVRL